MQSLQVQPASVKRCILTSMWKLPQLVCHNTGCPTSLSWVAPLCACSVKIQRSTQLHSQWLSCRNLFFFFLSFFNKKEDILLLLRWKVTREWSPAVIHGPLPLPLRPSPELHINLQLWRKALQEPCLPSPCRSLPQPSLTFTAAFVSSCVQYTVYYPRQLQREKS